MAWRDESRSPNVRTRGACAIALLSAWTVLVGCSRSGLAVDPGGSLGVLDPGSDEAGGADAGRSTSAAGAGGEPEDGATTTNALPTCGRPGTQPPPDQPLERLKHGFAASWRGSATQTLGGDQPSPFPVEITFRADGSYSARCMLPDGCSAFYYDDDADSPEKRYTLEKVQDDGTAIGIIRIHLAEGPGGAKPALLKKILLSEDLSALSFEFHPSWLGNPGTVQYELGCSLP